MVRCDDHSGGGLASQVTRLLGLGVTVAMLGLGLWAGPVEARARVVPKVVASARPVVVELFTAQGCQRCPEANETAIKLAEDPSLLVLTFPVDYWDYLGWRDTFAQPGFTQRQKAYQSAFHLREFYTPQVVIDGRKELSGLKTQELTDFVAHADEGHSKAPRLRVQKLRLTIGAGPLPRGGAQVLLVRYDPRILDVPVKKGDNKGLVVRQQNVVREIVVLGEWKGRPMSLKLPKGEGYGLNGAILVQSKLGARILGAMRLEEAVRARGR